MKNENGRGSTWPGRKSGTGKHSPVSSSKGGRVPIDVSYMSFGTRIKRSRTKGGYLKRGVKIPLTRWNYCKVNIGLWGGKKLRMWKKGESTSRDSHQKKTREQYISRGKLVLAEEKKRKGEGTSEQKGAPSNSWGVRSSFRKTVVAQHS